MLTDDEIRADWVMVPREPTEAMHKAFHAAIALWMLEQGSDGDVYRAMIAAAPQPITEHSDASVLRAFNSITNGDTHTHRFSHAPVVMVSQEHYDALVDEGPDYLGKYPQPNAETVPWLLAIDEAMAIHELGVANIDDNYETAKAKMHALLCAAQGIGEFFAQPNAERDEHRANMTEIAILLDRVSLLRRAVADAKAQGLEHMPIASLEVYLGVNGSAK